jgi:hypothetical protein
MSACKKHEIPSDPKRFKAGEKDCYAQIPAFIYNDDMCGGQISKKTKLHNSFRRSDLELHSLGIVVIGYADMHDMLLLFRTVRACI